MSVAQGGAGSSYLAIVRNTLAGGHTASVHASGCLPERLCVVSADCMRGMNLRSTFPGCSSSPATPLCRHTAVQAQHCSGTPLHVRAVALQSGACEGCTRATLPPLPTTR